jgi:hypothetical protein
MVQRASGPGIWVPGLDGGIVIANFDCFFLQIGLRVTFEVALGVAGGRVMECDQKTGHWVQLRSDDHEADAKLDPPPSPGISVNLPPGGGRLRCFTSEVIRTSATHRDDLFAFGLLVVK